MAKKERKFNLVTDKGGLAFSIFEKVAGKAYPVGMDEAQAKARMGEANDKAEALGIKTRYILDPA